MQLRSLLNRSFQVALRGCATASGRLDALLCSAWMKCLVKRQDLEHKVMLVTQFYRPGNPERMNEIESCLERNTSLPWIKSVHLFCENGSFPARKLRILPVSISIHHRPSFGDFFRYLTNLHLPEETIVVLANSDIYLDPSTHILLEGLRDDDLVALARYETIDAKAPFMIDVATPGTESLSQDVWIFKSCILKRLPLDEIPCLPLGVPGCENALAAFLYNNGIQISNPCIGIKSIHNHRSQERSYAERIVGLYAFPPIQTCHQFLCGRRFVPRLAYYDGFCFSDVNQ